jgi:hypothetical protein
MGGRRECAEGGASIDEVVREFPDHGQGVFQIQGPDEVTQRLVVLVN